MGVYLTSGATLTNKSGGVITGATHGVYVFDSSGTVTNAGSITGR